MKRETPGAGDATRELSMNCRRCREVRYLWVDGELEEAVCDAFQTHRRDCPECDELARLTLTILELVRRRARRSTAPPQLRRRIRTVLVSSRFPGEP